MDPVIAAIVDHLDRFAGRLPPRLSDAFAELRRRQHAEPGSIARALANPLTHPIAALPGWVAERVGRVDLVGTAATAAVVGYLHVRCVDDVIDGDTADVPAATVLGASLLAHAVGLLMSIAPSMRYRLALDATLAKAHEALLHERELASSRGVVDGASFGIVLGKTAPLALPALAIVDAADAWDMAADIEELVFHESWAAQLVDDLADAVDDAAHDVPTWVRSRYGPRRDLMRNLIAGGLDEVVEEALEATGRLATVVERVGLDAAVPWVEARRVAVRAIPARVVGAILRATPPTS